MSLRSLREELESRQVFKAWEIEENLDRYFCRPVAVLFTAAFLPLRITPNQVSVGGMLIGMASAFFLFGPSYAALVLAVVLLWTSEVLDAADGQLARLSTRPSRYGRIIDGMCSMALFLTIYTVLGIGLYLDTGDWTFPLLALAALFAHSFQSSLYDFYRTEYIRVVKKREAADEDSLQALERAQRDEAPGQSLGKRLMLGLYKSYARRLARTTPTYQPLKMAIEERTVTPGLIHHSDQGVQYACQEYVKLLQEHQITISMSRKGNPYENAMAESFMKTLKTEEVYINEYNTISDARINIEHFIEVVYNKKRLHSSLGYRTPEEIEAEFNNTFSTLAVQESVSAEG